MISVLGELISASPESLRELRSRLSGEDRIYGDVLQAYLLNRNSDLEALFQKLSAQRVLQDFESDETALLIAVKIRRDIRQRLSQKIELDRLSEKTTTSPFSKIWQGEISFLLGLAYENLGDNVAARSMYAQASALLADEAPKKSLKAELNELVALSRIHPESKLIPEYLALAKRALKNSARGLAGVAFLNVSREFQKLSALELALDYANQALDKLEEDRGALHFYLALAHRTELYLQLDRPVEALKDFQAALPAPFDEVREVLKMLQIPLASAEAKELRPREKFLTPTWRERWMAVLKPESASETKLTTSEQKLIGALADGPRDRFELIEALYGQTQSFFEGENRLKVLLSRLRRKRPLLILLIQGKYQLSDLNFARLSS